MPALIDLQGVRKDYPMKGEVVQALRGVTLSVDVGDYVSIMGSSGSGKSTLLYVIGLLATATAGSYRFLGEEVGALTDARRSRLRGRRIGFVFQSFHLLPQFTVVENVLMGARYAEERGGNARDRARILLERVGLGHRLGHRPAELSNGEMQRAAIARALLGDPELILADEPTGNLDARNGEEVAALLESLHREGRTVLVITHNPALAERAPRRIVLRDGEVAA